MIMRFRRQKSHVIDFLFPMALLFVFAVSALTVILLAANIYRSTAKHSSLNYTAGTSLSYISEKIHQGDENGDVSLGTFDGHEALVLGQEYQGDAYYTYIYADQGELRELYIKGGTKADSSAGRAVLPLKSFTMKELSKQTFSFTCVDEDGQEATAIVSVHSMGDSHS